MTTFKARVKNGQLVLDEPATDLPEGAEVELLIVDDELDADDRAALDESLRESVEQMQRGELIDADEVFAKLRARR